MTCAGAPGNIELDPAKCDEQYNIYCSGNYGYGKLQVSEVNAVQIVARALQLTIIAAITHCGAGTSCCPGVTGNRRSSLSSIATLNQLTILR